VLGVALAIALIEALEGQRCSYEIEVIGFSEESGQRFGTPFLGSRALVGRIDEALLETKDSSDITLREAITQYGLDPADLPEALLTPDTFAFLEYHIERGPVLESLHKSLGVVEAIVGRSRFTVEFIGEPSNSGTTPMNLRRDALSGAAEWIGMVEQEARSVNGLFATVEKVEVFPGATGVIPSNVTMSVDMRHHSDKTLNGTIARLLEKARHVAQKRRLRFDFHRNLDHQAVVMHPGLVHTAERALRCHDSGRENPLHTHFCQNPRRLVATSRHANQPGRCGTRHFLRSPFLKRNHRFYPEDKRVRLRVNRANTPWPWSPPLLLFPE
jgi:allantoate deiminase